VAHNESQNIEKIGKRRFSARYKRVAHKSDGKANIVSMSGSPKPVYIGVDCTAPLSELDIGNVSIHTAASYEKSSYLPPIMLYICSGIKYPSPVGSKVQLQSP